MPLVARLYGPRDVRVEEEDVGLVEGSRIRVRTILSSISSGTEMAFWRGTHPRMSEDYRAAMHPRITYPVVLGYEEVCRVVEVGEECEYLKPGDTVFASIGHREEALIEEVEPVEASTTFPFGQVGPYKVPDGVDLEESALAIFAATGLNAIRRSRMGLGDRVAVIGQGAIGLTITALLKLAGAGEIIAIDPLERRLKVAEELGVDHQINPRTLDLVDYILAETNGAGVDIVFDCAGSPEALRDALKITRYGGRIVVVAMHTKPLAHIILGTDFHLREIEIVSAQGEGRASMTHPWDRKRNIQYFFNLLAGRRISLKPLITHRIPFRAINQAYKLIDEKPEEAIKVHLTF